MATLRFTDGRARPTEFLEWTSLGCLINFCPVVCIYLTRGAPVGHDSSVAHCAQGTMQGQGPLSRGDDVARA